MSSSNRGQSYTDPLYDQIEARLERKYGLPRGGISAIRTKGERSNADQVSPAGARTVYQVMPATRDLFLKKYGVDAFSGPEGAAEVAALHLRDSMQRNGGSWSAAVREYHGGTDRRQWGPENARYLERVTGENAREHGPPGKYTTPVGETHAATIDVAEVPMDDLLGLSPDELFSDARRPLPPKPKKPDDAEIRAKLAGGDGIAASPIDTTVFNAEKQMGTRAAAAQAELDSFGPLDRIKALWSETLTDHLFDALDDSTDKGFDPEFTKHYRENWQEIESFAQNDREVDMLREANNAEHLATIRLDIMRERENEKIIGTAWSPTMARIGMGVLDPVGWAAGLGAGKAFQMLGVGSRALIAAGRPVAGALAAGAEGTVGNLAFTAGLDATGEYVDPSEYVTSALTGFGIGLALHGVSQTISKGGDEATLTKMVEDMAMTERATQAERIAAVHADLPNATPEEVVEEVQRRVVQDHQKVMEMALADVPADQRLMVHEEILTDNAEFKTQVEAANDLASVSDITERAMVAEAIARADRLAGAASIDKKALQTILARVGQESTAGRLLQSKSSVARAVALSLLENAQGAGGRRRTAAIAQAQRERIYNETFAGFDKQAELFRNQEGISVLRDAWNGSSRNTFNRRVFAELEARGTPNYVADASPQVVRAAHFFEQGMDMMRQEQQHVGTVGNLRLGDSSVGYVPHRLDPRKVLALTPEQTKRVRATLSGQFQEIEGFDATFSDTLAAKYLGRALSAARGSYAIPFNLHSPEAGQIVRDVLEGMNLPGDDLEKLMGKFSRGGAGHTKRRLKLDLEADIGDGAKLMDLFVTDIPTLYRSYARRVSGEVALAQYGVMGEKGLNILRTAMEAQGATPKDMRSFDQVAAEFLNTPYGEHNHAWMDNVRIATSASRLGGMGFTQFAEFGNAIPALGMQGMIKGMTSIPRLIGEVRALARGEKVDSILNGIETLTGHQGMDDYHMTRMFDVRDNSVELYNGESLGVVSRAVRGGAHANMILSGHRMVLAVQTRGMAEQIVRKAVKFAKSGEADAALDDMGIHAELRAALKADMDRIATFDAKGELVSLDLFNGKALMPHMVAELAQSIERGASQIIQRTYTGETGAWAHDGFLKLLTQFRTFSLTSVEKQWGRNLKNYGALKSAMYLAGAASMALPIHLARVYAKTAGMSEAEAKKHIDNNTNALALTRATLNYASAAGLLGDIADVGAGFASSYGGDFGERLGDNYGVRGRGGPFLGGVVAPGAGFANDAWTGMLQGDPKKLVRSLPGSNLPYVAPFVNAAFQKD